MAKLDQSYHYLSTRPGVARWREGTNGAPDIVERLTSDGDFVPSKRSVEEIEDGARYVDAPTAEVLCDTFVRRAALYRAGLPVS